MKHAYLIIAHNEPEVLSLLLQSLDYERNDIYLHIDRRAEQMRHQFSLWKPQYAGFSFLDNPTAVCWGDISQIEVEIRLFQKAHACGPYAYYHLLSGTDLPLHPQAEIHHFFNQHPGCEFVHFWHEKSHREDLKRRIGRYYFFTRHLKDKGTFIHFLTAPVRNVALAIQKMARYQRFPLPEFQKGSNWVSITEGFCSYLLEQAPSILRRYRFTLAPDEIFLQTILWHSPFRAHIFSLDGNITQASLRQIDWQRGNPYVWQETDLPKLLCSKALFARKFSSASPALLKAIASRISKN